MNERQVAIDHFGCYWNRRLREKVREMLGVKAGLAIPTVRRSTAPFGSVSRRHTTTSGTAHSWHTRLVLWRQKPLLERVGFFLKIIRIPTVAAGIYSLGYRQGLIESLQNPTLFQEKIMLSVLDDVGATLEDCEILSASDVVGKSNQRQVATRRNHQISYVAQQLVEQSRRHIARELSLAKESNDEKSIEFWEAAFLRINGAQSGQAVESDPWRFVFIKTDYSNAFVTELIPRHIFITSAMIDEAKTVDEVAFVLGHELSHLILGHTSRKTKISSALKTTELVLLSLDPTEGLLAFAIVFLLGIVRLSAEQSYSREYETEADDLGLRLVAACEQFDLAAGSRFMYRNHIVVRLVFNSINWNGRSPCPAGGTGWAHAYKVAGVAPPES